MRRRRMDQRRRCIYRTLRAVPDVKERGKLEAWQEHKQERAELGRPSLLRTQLGPDAVSRSWCPCRFRYRSAVASSPQPCSQFALLAAGREWPQPRMLLTTVVHLSRTTSCASGGPLCLQACAVLGLLSFEFALLAREPLGCMCSIMRFYPHSQSHPPTSAFASDPPSPSPEIIKPP